MMRHKIRKKAVEGRNRSKNGSEGAVAFASWFRPNKNPAEGQIMDKYKTVLRSDMIGRSIEMRAAPLPLSECDPDSGLWQQAYDALINALERMAKAEWEIDLRRHRKARKKGLPRPTTMSEARLRVSDQLYRLMRCRITPEEAMATVHEGGVFYELYERSSTKKNPSSPHSLRKAERLYETFHQFEPTDVGEFHKGFKIPREATYVGEAKTMYYTSDKLNPETGEDEGHVRYFHPHEGGVRMYVTDDSPGETRNVPPWIYKTEALVLIGQCDGFEYKDFDGVMQEAKATGRKPEWFCIPSGKALLIIQDRRRVLAIVWGGKLNVEWRGVVG